MRGLIALTGVMAVMIVAGVIVVAVTIMHRLSGAGSGRAFDATIDEPAGTHIVSASQAAGGIALVLSGGGPDRIVILGQSGQVTGRVALRTAGH